MSLSSYQEYKAMSTYSYDLKRFIFQVHKSESDFPRIQLKQYCDKYSPSISLIQNTYQQLHQAYSSSPQHFKELIILMYLSFLRQSTALILQALQFLQDLMISRMIMFSFRQGRIVIYENLVYLQELMELLVATALENGLVDELTEIFRVVNSNKTAKFNQINFLSEALLICKIKLFLQPQSLNEFKTFLDQTLIRQKLILLQKMESQRILNFDHLAYLRMDEDSCEIYALQVHDRQLIRVKRNSNVLPSWVQDPFYRMPKQLNLQPLRSRKIAEIYQMLMQLEIFSSSPLIQEVDKFITDEQILQFFSKFLMGEQLSQNQYTFGWEKVQNLLKQIQFNSKTIDACYSNAFEKEVCKMFQKSENK